MRLLVPVERALHRRRARVRLLDALGERLRAPLDVGGATLLHLQLVLALLLQAPHGVLRLGHALRHLAPLSLAAHGQTLLRGDQTALALLHRNQRAGETLLRRRARLLGATVLGFALRLAAPPLALQRRHALRLARAH